MSSPQFSDLKRQYFICRAAAKLCAVMTELIIGKMRLNEIWWHRDRWRTPLREGRAHYERSINDRSRGTSIERCRAARITTSATPPRTTRKYLCSAIDAQTMVQARLSRLFRAADPRDPIDKSSSFSSSLPRVLAGNRRSGLFRITRARAFVGDIRSE